MRGGGIQESKMAYHSGGSSGDLTSGDEIDQQVHTGMLERVAVSDILTVLTAYLEHE